MKRSTLLGITGIFLFVLPLLSFAQDPVDVSAEITAANESFMEAIKAGDVEAVVKHYTADARIMPPDAPVFEGTENIRNMWAVTFEAGPMDLRFKVVSAEGFGNTAIEEGAYKILAPDGQAVDHGKYIVIWKKVDGKWLLHQDIFNSSVPPQGM